MSDGFNSCLNVGGAIALIIGLVIWVNKVDVVRVTQQLPPPQDSWSVVYPQFKDDVSAQLLNTQKIAGSVLDSTNDLKTQNAELQNSVNLLLNNLGILKQESYNESIRQRNENILYTILSVIFGWWLGAFVTPEGIKKFRENMAKRSKKDPKSQVTQSNGSSINHLSNNSTPAISLAQTVGAYPRAVSGPSRPPSSQQSPPVKLCPTCGIPMNIQKNSQGKRIYVCKNFNSCRQNYPYDF